MLMCFCFWIVPHVQPRLTESTVQKKRPGESLFPFQLNEFIERNQFIDFWLTCLSSKLQVLNLDIQFFHGW